MKNRIILPVVLALVAVAIAASFTWYTQHVWEDFYITYRVSKNLVLGHGLVFQIGERVHTFTSPLGVLLPALTLWLVGGTSDAGALLGFRVLSVLAFAGSVSLLWILCRRVWQLPTWICAVVVVLLLIDGKAVDFSINGMETAFMLLLLAAWIYVLQSQSNRSWLALGVCAAALQWTRPDAFLLGFAVALGFYLFAPQVLFGKSRRASLPNFGRGLALAAVLYAPWVIWAWIYYGSPVPNTILAKAQPLTGWVISSWREWLGIPWLEGFGATALPIYAHMGGWPIWPLAIGYWTACLLGHWWLLPWADARGRACSFGAFLFGLYLSQVKLYPWYLPPASLLGMATAAFALTDFKRWLGVMGRWSWIGPAAVSALLVTLQLLLFVHTARQVKLQEQLIEGQRTAIGVALREKAQPTDRVFLECIGYIGFNSGLKILDYPGLTAPEIVRARHEIADDWGALVNHFKPEWLVLRPREVLRVSSPAYPQFKAEYYVAGTFSQEKELDRVQGMPGLDYLRFDQTFYVFHRQ